SSDLRNASAPGLVLRPESIAQELFLRGDDGTVLDREEQRDDAEQPEVVRDQAETEADAQVAEIERVARQRVGTVGVQRNGDQLLVLSRGSVGQLAQNPRAQHLSGGAGRETYDRPQRGGRTRESRDKRDDGQDDEDWREA